MSKGLAADSCRAPCGAPPRAERRAVWSSVRSSAPCGASYGDACGTALCHLHPNYSTAYPGWVQYILGMSHPDWLWAVSEKLSGSTLLLLLHSLPQAAPPGQHLPLYLPKSLTRCSFSCCQSLVLPRLMVKYS